MGIMKDYDRRIRQGGDDAIAALSEYVAAVEPRWIPVGEQLPKEGQQVLTARRLPEWTDEMPSLISTHDYERIGFCDEDDGQPCCLVTHWMPLPEPPC